MSDPETPTEQDIDGHIADLVREARAAGHSKDEIVEALRYAADGLEKDEDDAA